jgi:hypothetical protein
MDMYTCVGVEIYSHLSCAWLLGLEQFVVRVVIKAFPLQLQTEGSAVHKLMII